MTWIAGRHGGTQGFGAAFTYNELIHMKEVLTRDIGTHGGFSKLIDVLEEAEKISEGQIKELEAKVAMLKGGPIK